jgi:hypothetical protein
MSRWPSHCLGVVVVCALAVSLHGQSRDRGGAVRGATPAAPAAQAGGAVSVTIPQQLMHIRFPKAVTVQQNVTAVQDVRAHLESPLLGTVPGSTKKVVILPSDIDVNLDINLTDADATKTSARMQLRIASANVDPAEGRRRFFGGAEVSHEFVGFPKPGDVLIPAGTTLSIPYAGATNMVGQAALAATDPNANRAEDSYPSHPILGNVSMRIALVDTPIDVNNAGANKLFHAQVTEEMQWGVTGGSLPPGAINPKKGADVYVRSYEPDPSAPLGHFAVWSVDFVVVDAKKIPVNGLGLREAFAPGSMAISPDGKGRIPMILWPLNQPRVFTIVEQQEVSANGATLWTYPTTTDIAAPGSAPVVTTTSNRPAIPNAPPEVQETLKRANDLQACNAKAVTDHAGDQAGMLKALQVCREAAGAPGAASASRTPTAPAAPAVPADIQSQIDAAKKRADDLVACQDKARKDHAGDPTGLAKAMNDCRTTARQSAQPQR